MATVADLGKKFKEKNPDYAWADDAELGRKLKVKYPGGYDDFTDIQKNPIEGLSGPASIDPKKIIQPVSRNPLEPNVVQQQVNQGKQVPVGSTPEEVGKMAGEALPMAGAGIAGIPGAAIGSAIQNYLMKGRVPGNEGEGSLTSVAKDTILQGVVPAGINKIGPALSKEGLINTISRKFISNKSPSIQGAIKEEGAVNATNAIKPMVHPEEATVKEIADNANLPQPAYISGKLKGIRPDKSLEADLYKAANGDISLSKVSDRVFSNIDDLRKLKIIDPSGTEKLGLSRIFKRAFDGPKVNPDKVLEELSGSNSDLYKEAINPETHKNIISLMNEAKAISEKPAGWIEKALTYRSGRFLLPIAGIGLIPGGHVVAGSVALAGGTMALTESAIAKLMQNPESAKLVLQAIKTPLNLPESGLLTKAITMLARGSAVIVKDSDGNDTKAIIGPDGKPQPSR